MSNEENKSSETPKNPTSEKVIKGLNINEGMVKKGGVNRPPKNPRPRPPAAQAPNMHDGNQGQSDSSTNE